MSGNNKGQWWNDGRECDNDVELTLRVPQTPESLAESIYEDTSTNGILSLIDNLDDLMSENDFTLSLTIILLFKLLNNFEEEFAELLESQARDMEEGGKGRFDTSYLASSMATSNDIIEKIKEILGTIARSESLMDMVYVEVERRLDREFESDGGN